MKLEKYLADYIKHELEDNSDLTMQEILQQGIEAFESTENAKVDVRFEDVTCNHSFVDGVIADEGEEECRFCGWRRYK